MCSSAFLAHLFSLVVVAYALYAISSGKVLGDRRTGKTWVYRDEQPFTFWVIVLSFLGFAGFLFFYIK
jgi:hypothetical protein